jgi:hypothetical protein
LQREKKGGYAWENLAIMFFPGKIDVKKNVGSD